MGVQTKKRKDISFLLYPVLQELTVSGLYVVHHSNPCNHLTQLMEKMRENKRRQEKTFIIAGRFSGRNSTPSWTLI